MATEDLTRVLRVPGRICIAPTSFATVFPHGGTALGSLYHVALQPRSRIGDIRHEEKGGVIGDKLLCGTHYRLTFVLRQWDADALNLLEAKITGTSTDLVLQGTRRGGTLVTPVALAFSPYEATKPGVLFRRALVCIGASAELNLHLLRPLEIGIVVDAGDTAAGTTPWEVGRLTDITP